MVIDPSKAIGFFNGLEEDGLSFGAEITLNYDVGYQSRPMIGMYVFVELERPEEAVLGRICAISSHGRLASPQGDDLGVRTVSENRIISEDLKKAFLRYKCSIRLLGLIRESAGQILFTPSQRRLPHLGAKVTFADSTLLQAVAGAQRSGESIGFLAFGEFIYALGHASAPSFGNKYQLRAPIVEPRFDASSMVARRTAVLARSGYGKSNLLKILFARLYANPPKLSMNGVDTPVGTLVFDPEGDYFWPGAGPNASPGLCDIPELVDQIVLATDRKHSQPYYNSFRVTTPKPDLRELSPGLVLSCALTADRLKHRGTENLFRMPQDNWRSLVDAAWLENTYGSHVLSAPFIKEMCHLGNTGYEVIAGGIRNTMLDLVAKLHDPRSTLIPAVKQGLTDGKLVIVDLSLMRGQPANSLAAMILRYIFEFNVEEYTKADTKAIPVIALIEEAQKVLEGSNSSNAPFIEWVKEGRKYNLGAVLVTQQPGAIDEEILSQTDNFFVFHLISGGDLNALKKANGHFSDDILATLLNEPIEGQGVFWSSAGEKTTYPIPFRAHNFVDICSRLPGSALSTNPSNYAMKLSSRLVPGTVPTLDQLPQPDLTSGLSFPSNAQLTKQHRDAAKALEKDNIVHQGTFPLFLVSKWLKENDFRKKGVDDFAVCVLTVLFGLYGYGWTLESKISTKGAPYVLVKKLDVKGGLELLERGEQPKLPDNHDEVGFEDEFSDDAVEQF
jgi:hypothetical protein